MEVGILTFHCANNFGAVLQCYALASFLEKQKHNVQIIDYKPKYLLKTTFLFPTLKDFILKPIRSTKTIIKTLINLRSRIKSIQSFDDFRKKNFHLFKFNNDTNLNVFNSIIIGSDQVWNNEITNGFDYYFWGEFKTFPTKLIAYAASSGRYNFKKNELSLIKKKLSLFDSISVREEGLRERLKEVYHKNIKVVLDPTLLLKKEDYYNFYKNPLINIPYILIYEVVHDDNTERIAQLLAKQLNVNIIKIGSKSKDKFINSITNLGPADFINYIYYSSCIVTTSFHGTAFSIILNKPFYTIKLGNQIDERSQSLLSSLNLSHRHIEKDSSPTFEKIDYNITMPLLENLRINSQNFLKEQL